MIVDKHTSFSRLASSIALSLSLGILSSCQSPEDDGEFWDEGNRVSQIVGGHDADPTPYFAMILSQSSDGSWHSRGCGASLISSCHVLTAAHCVDGTKADLADGVYINAYEPYAGNSGVLNLFIQVDKVIAHEGFVDSNNTHDVALLRLKQCVTDGRFAPVKLADPEHGLTDGQMLEAYGFGKLAEDDGTLVQTLQEVSVPFIEHEECKRRYSSLADDSLCAGYEQGGKDSCQGDSGGPLVDSGGSEPVQVGVVSWGVGCARAGSPGVYASVSDNYDWIAKRVCSDDREDGSKLCGRLGVNGAPVAQADVVFDVVFEGNYVSLEGKSSYDPDGDNLSFEWKQIGGPDAQLSDNGSPDLTFKAPEVSRNAILTFELVVSDGREDSLPATIAITVRDRPSTSLDCTRVRLSDGMGGAGGILRCR